MARFGKDDWMVLGLAQLSAEGPEGLKLDRLCAAAGRTRGSFYHHFRDHDDFLRTMLEHWRDWHTLDVIDAADLAELTGEGARARLNRIAAGIDPAMEAGIRRLAAGYAPAKAAVDRVDEERIAYLAQLTEDEHGADPGRARALAEIEYAAYVGAQHLFPEMEETRALAMAELLDEMVAALAQRPTA